MQLAALAAVAARPPLACLLSQDKTPSLLQETPHLLHENMQPLMYHIYFFIISIHVMNI